MIQKNSTLSTLSTHTKDPSNLSSLSDAQRQVVAALAQGRTITAAARQAQLHRSTIHNWLNDIPAFREALADARSQYSAQLRDEMKELSGAALETLRTLLQDPQTPAPVRLHTSLAILERQDWRLPAVTNSSADYETRTDRDLEREIDQQLLALGNERMLSAEEDR